MKYSRLNYREAVLFNYYMEYKYDYLFFNWVEENEKDSSNEAKEKFFGGTIFGFPIQTFDDKTK